MTHELKLFIPGPCDIDDGVLQSMSLPVQRSYGGKWTPLYHETLDLIRQVFQTHNDIFIVPGPGSAGLDMALGSMLANGEKVIVAHNGFFGERMAFIAECNGLNVIRVGAPLGRIVDPEDIKKALAANPDALAVAVVHHETSTTVLNPVRDIAAVTSAAGRVLLVDAVSSLAGTELPVDQWGIDVCVTASNKCLEAPPGLAVLSVGPRAWDLVNRHEQAAHGWYLNLKTWRWYAENWGHWHPAPVTMPTGNVLALRASLMRIVQGGLDRHIEKHKRACKCVRSFLRQVGFDLLVEESWAAPTATAVKPRPEFTAADMIQWLEGERGVCIAGGLGDWAGKIFRVGHLGKSTSEPYLAEFTSAVEEFLRFKGVQI